MMKFFSRLVAVMIAVVMVFGYVPMLEAQAEVRNNPAASPSNVTTISNAYELSTLLEGGPESEGRTFRLTNDITVLSWRPVADFRGHFDGAGHRIELTTFARGHFPTAGLFSCVGQGTVLIENLHLTGSVNARADNSGNSRAYAGGFIGHVFGGNVTIRNSSFSGSVSARSMYDKITSAIRENPIQAVIEFVVFNAPVPGAGPATVAFETIQLIVKAAHESGYALQHNVIYRDIMSNGSRAYAGGFIGRIGGRANVQIINSFAANRPLVSNVEAIAGADSFRQTSAIIGTGRAQSYAGGLVGIRADGQLTIENCYVINNIRASADASFIGSIGARPRSHAGSLVGNGGAIFRGNSYRIDTQNLTVNRAYTFSLRLGHTNNLGTTALTSVAMRNQNSFVGWDFDTQWTMGSTMPTPRVYVEPQLQHPHPHIRTESLPIGLVGWDYSYRLSGLSYFPRWSFESGTLPAGLNFSGHTSGGIGGRPTSVETTEFTVRLTNAVTGEYDLRKFTISVVERPEIRTEILPGSIRSRELKVANEISY